MPSIRLVDGADLHLEDDYFGEPWVVPEVVLLIHGTAESGVAWYGWMPTLTRSFRVLRPDLRGSGRSSAPRHAGELTPDRLASDLRALLDIFQIERVHVVGAKYGAAVAIHLASAEPARVRSLSLVGGLVKGWRWREPERSQERRLGTDVPPAQAAWWAEYMAETDPTTTRAVVEIAGRLDLVDLVSSLTTPTLVITTDDSPMESVESVLGWQRLLKNSRLLVLPGDGYHVAATRPAECASHVHAFIEWVLDGR